VAISSRPRNSSHHGYSQLSLDCTTPIRRAPDARTTAPTSAYCAAQDGRVTNRLCQLSSVKTDWLPTRRRGHPYRTERPPATPPRTSTAASGPATPRRAATRPAPPPPEHQPGERCRQHHQVQEEPVAPRLPLHHAHVQQQPREQHVRVDP